MEQAGGFKLTKAGEWMAYGCGHGHTQACRALRMRLVIPGKHAIGPGRMRLVVPFQQRDYLRTGENGVGGLQWGPGQDG